MPASWRSAGRESRTVERYLTACFADLTTFAERGDRDETTLRRLGEHRTLERRGRLRTLVPRLVSKRGLRAALPVQP